MRMTCTRWFAAALLAWTIPVWGQDITANSFYDSGLPETARQAWEATLLLETRTWRGSLRVPAVATGSGLVVERAGRTIWIATSSHVVRCQATCLIRVYLSRQGSGGGRVSAAAELWWRDPGRDLALLRAFVPRKATVRVAHAADSSQVARSAISGGTGVLAIGFPDLTVLSGHARRSGRPLKRYSTGRLHDSLAGFGADYVPYGSNRAEGRLELARALAHDADLLPGSSGGPLIDSSGLVLGINTGSLSPRGDESCAERRERCRIHLAVPVDDLLQTVRELEAKR